MKKKLILFVGFAFSLTSLQLFAGRGGSSFAGGFVGGTFGGMLGSAITSNSRGSSDDGVSRRTVRKIYEEIDDLKIAVRKDLEGLSDRIDELYEMFQSLRTRVEQSATGSGSSSGSAGDGDSIVEQRKSVKEQRKNKRKNLKKRKRNRFNTK